MVVPGGCRHEHTYSICLPTKPLSMAHSANWWVCRREGRLHQCPCLQSPHSMQQQQQPVQQQQSPRRWPDLQVAVASATAGSCPLLPAAAMLLLWDRSASQALPADHVLQPSWPCCICLIHTILRPASGVHAAHACQGRLVQQPPPHPHAHTGSSGRPVRKRLRPSSPEEPVGAGWPAHAHASKLVWQSDCADGCSPAPLVLRRLQQIVGLSVPAGVLAGHVGRCMSLGRIPLSRSIRTTAAKALGARHGAWQPAPSHLVLLAPRGWKIAAHGSPERMRSAVSAMQPAGKRCMHSSVSCTSDLPCQEGVSGSAVCP